MKWCLRCSFAFVIFFTVDLFAVNDFSIEQVRLLDGPFKHAQDLNIDHLLQYDVDRLLAPYLKEAGLEPKGKSFKNWSGMDGHVGGHYLSAVAMYVASTGNADCKMRMEYMIAELDRCQRANGDGYVGGVPDGKEMWDELATGDVEVITKRWVPWYNIHKLYAGLRDAWLYGKSEKAKDILIKLCDWTVDELKGLSDEQMEKMMDTEYGGMNEVLADVYEITGDEKYFDLAKRFCHRQLLDPMSQQRDSLDNRHANTQVPKAVGFQRIAELGGGKKYDEAAKFFWDTVVHNRSLAFGGNSRREHFPAKSAAFEMVEEREGPESCNTYNMLKLTKGLHRMTDDASYADYYERALFNHILSTQNPEHGGYVYFTPARPRHYRVYSAPNEAMWCCVGSGMENHAKYGEFIYSYDKDMLMVNLFIASVLDWEDMGVKLTQETVFPEQAGTTIKLELDEPKAFEIKIRHPEWSKLKYEVKVNGDKVDVDSKPGSYCSLNRRWETGDTISVKMEMDISLEQMPDVPDYVAVLYGPIVLAAPTGDEDLKGLVADDSRWGHIAHGELEPLDEAPMFVADKEDIPDLIQPVSDQPLHFITEEIIMPDKYSDLVLQPFYQTHDCRYEMYWKCVSPGQYQQMAAAMKAQEQRKLLLDKNTLDRVIPGEQQPEADHGIEQSRSSSGVYRNKYLRHVQAPGWFSYVLNVDSGKQLELLVTYWGNESGKRTFDIFIDDKKLVTENLIGKWKREEFVDVKYPLTNEFIGGEKTVTIKFVPHEGNYAGGIFDLRVLTVE